MNWIESVRHDIASLRSLDKDLRKFGITVGVVLLLLSMAAEWMQWWIPELIYGIGFIGIIMMFFGIVIPRYLKRIHRYWMSAAIIIGSIVSRIILSIIFFTILTPVAIIARMYGKQFLHGLKNDKQASLWIIRDRTKKINYERMS